MYEYTPEKNKKLIYPAVLFLFLCGAFLMMPSELPDSVSLFLRALGLWFILCGVFVTDRCIATSYTYIIEYDGDGCDFIVKQKYFRRIRVVCRISAKNIVSLETRTPSSKFVFDRKTAKLDYRPERMSRKWTVLTVNEEEKNAYILFSPDGKMFSILNGFTKV